ncbi:MAG: hypothetical protein HZB55_14480 [Deltaproteobacteria bacterium]|nr:hypothetical protein [Deltaproteobacteria bacterium]
MAPRGERGMVLVACLLILALLSLLGATSLFNATLDTQFVGNQKVNRESFYAAEAALELGVGKVMTSFRQELRPLVPDHQWTEPQGLALNDPFGNPFNGYTTQYRIGNALDPSHPDTEPKPQPYSTAQNGQQILHFAYIYGVEATAEGPNGTARLTETLRALETPLVQYYVFFSDDLSWHHGPTMTSWGRIHTNGNLYFAPQDTSTFQNVNLATPAQFAPNQITVSGNIYYGTYLAQNNGTLTRASSPVRMRVRNLGSTTLAAGDFELINQDITSANQGTEELRFKDSDDSYHVRVGVDPMPTVSAASIQRGDFYENQATQPRKDRVDGITILADNGALVVTFALQGTAPPPTDVTAEIRAYNAAPGVAVNRQYWDPDALTNADGTQAASVAALVAGSMVYSKEAPVGGAVNPRYPYVLERRDGRENRDVDLTVVDLQRLECWYRDRLDYLDNFAVDRSNWDTAVNPSADTSDWNPKNRSLLIYVSRPVTAGANLQAVKVIGSRAGRTRGDNVANLGSDRQSGPTLLARTTLVTDTPLYLEGDFNAPSASASPAINNPGTFGCAILSDAVTLLSNRWGSNTTLVYPNAADAGRLTYGFTGGAFGALPAAWLTTYNAAFFTGRYNFRTGGNAGEEAGIHNFVRFLENWGGQTCTINGCLINLWFSQRATAAHGGGYYSPPNRNFGWDVNFANSAYWPPYVPSIYNVERVSWQVE